MNILTHKIIKVQVIRLGTGSSNNWKKLLKLKHCLRWTCHCLSLSNGKRFQYFNHGLSWQIFMRPLICKNIYYLTRRNVTAAASEETRAKNFITVSRKTIFSIAESALFFQWEAGREWFFQAYSSQKAVSSNWVTSRTFFTRPHKRKITFLGWMFVCSFS